MKAPSWNSVRDLEVGDKPISFPVRISGTEIAVAEVKRHTDGTFKVRATATADESVKSPVEVVSGRAQEREFWKTVGVLAGIASANAAAKQNSDDF